MENLKTSSLARFHKLPDVKDKLKALCPKVPRKIPVPLKVKPRSKHYMMVGTAFDYLLRFELKRLAPHAICERLVAEEAADLVWTPGQFLYLTDPDETSPEEAEEIAKNAAMRIQAIVEKAKVAMGAYLGMNEPSQSVKADLAGHAIRLAKVDETCRALQINPSLEETDQEDVEDLLALLAIVPFDALIHPQTMLLNPAFGGVDADLITGDMLVDFKTTIGDRIEVDNLNQLLGYYLFTRHRRRVEPTLPAINRLAIYLCRHGYLWSLETAAWTDHQLFAETEEWFEMKLTEMKRNGGWRG